MLYTVIDLDAVMNTKCENRKQGVRSGNPYDYIRAGYYLDNAALFGGKNNVHYHLNFPGNTASDKLHTSHQ